jgi:hypothetical protein
MKKKLALSLAFAFTMGLAGTAFADSNPFVDVPKNHWSFDAVNQLAKDGIVDGYADKTFQGDSAITRYEMAQVVAKAVGKADKASAADKALIQKLYTEYKDELKSMDVRVSSLEGEVKDLKANDGKFTYTGQLRASYQNHKIDGVSRVANDGQNRFYLCLEGIVKVNDDWSAHFYNETSQYYGEQRSNAFNSDGEGGDSTWKRAWVSGKVGSVGVDFGKKWYAYGYNTAVGIQGTGFNANFGSGNLKTDLFFFKPSWGQLDIGVNTNMYGAHFNFAASNKTNISLLIGGNQKNDSLNNNITSWGELGFDTKLGPDFKLTAAVTKTNADNYNKNFYARLDYKGVDQNKAGSYGVYLRYWDRGRYGDPVADSEDDSLDNGGASGIAGVQGCKTFVIGAEYAIAKNIIWQNNYYHQNFKGVDKDGRIFRSHLDFHF